MAMLGPALAVLEDGLEVEAKGDGEVVSNRHEKSESTTKNENKKHGSIVHHFKLTETRIREGEYQETSDVDEVKDKVTSKADDDNRSRRCGCFGFLRAGKSKK